MGKIRHYQRYTVSGSGFINHIPTKNAVFSINDISASGMNITAEIDFAEDEVITMKIQFCGNAMPYSNQLKGMIVRKYKCDTIYHYGIRFMELSIRDIIEIDEYLRLNYGSAAPHQTSFDTGTDDNPIWQLSRRNDT